MFTYSLGEHQQGSAISDLYESCYMFTLVWDFDLRRALIGLTLTVAKVRFTAGLLWEAAAILESVCTLPCSTLRASLMALRFEFAVLFRVYI